MDIEEDAENGSPKRYARLDRIYTNSSNCELCPIPSSKKSKRKRAKKLLERLKLDLDVVEEIPESCPDAEFAGDFTIANEGKESRQRPKMKKDTAREYSEMDAFGGELGWSRKERRCERIRTCQFDPAEVEDSSSKNRDAAGSSGVTVEPVKEWVGLSFEGVSPSKFVGLQCKVYWPHDDDWYIGSITKYNHTRNQHHVRYDDGDEEWLVIPNEKISFFLSSEETQKMNLNSWHLEEDINYDELLELAASCYDYDEPMPGDVIWTKITGHGMWPALVTDQSRACVGGCLKEPSRARLIPVQFFGTYDYARVNTAQTVTLLRGLLSVFHLKCKHECFLEGLAEASRYLKEQKLPSKMACFPKDEVHDDIIIPCTSEDARSIEENEVSINSQQQEFHFTNPCPFEVGDLHVTSLGEVASDSKYFQSERCIWPVGYSASRKFTSVSDPRILSEYRMDVLRNPKSKTFPLFRVTLDNGMQIRGATPGVCWKKIYFLIQKTRIGMCNGRKKSRKRRKSGSYMFGFSNKKIRKFIQELAGRTSFSRSFTAKRGNEKHKDFPTSYRPVHIRWKELDRCNVCNMDEEYESNLFLQCDKCQMMVHVRCYGESDTRSGRSWLCNLCKPGGPDPIPPCCLCPVVGGALKATTDGRWAHLACVMLIPEACLVDIKKMEPIDGLDKINKDRWKLLCSICGVRYGACIQCSHSNCRVAYHPLCARADGLRVELEDEANLCHLLSTGEEPDPCLRLLSFCKKHRQPYMVSSEKIPTRVLGYHPINAPSINESGCARSEPYDYFRRRGRKEPEAHAAASLKRLYVENRPYLISGYRQNGEARFFNWNLASSRNSSCYNELEVQSWDTSGSFLSPYEKYDYMRSTFRKRLAFGKSSIHGFGIFARHPHRAGDMIIEYTGEIVRPKIADIREHRIYNSLVGAGTYMFRIDDERVIDATRAGSIAHLMNHSCEPNCYSRVITVKGDEHIIIFAKRDITQWEELTYDYRFFSIDQQLACYCGSPKCRGIVNDVESEGQVASIRVPLKDLRDWNILE